MKELEKGEWGVFCEIYGTTPRNRILEFFLEGRELDFGIGDVAAETGMNRATCYNTMEDLLQEGLIVPTRKIGKTQLYKLNTRKVEVKVLVQAFNLALGSIITQPPRELLAE